MQIVGLPFASLNDSMFGGCAIGYAAGFTGFTGVTGSVMGIVQPNASKINLYQSNNGAAGNLANTQFSNTSTIFLTASYEVP
ncbi:MAG: hypothetical protein ABI398_14855 [Devosia sp.]